MFRFPVQFHTVRASADEGAHSPRAPADPVLVDHDGRLYPLNVLLAQLPSTHVVDLDTAAPRSGQEAWDYVCRHWPTLAASIVAGTISAI